MFSVLIVQVSTLYIPFGTEARCYSSSNCQFGTEIEELNALFASEQELNVCCLAPDFESLRKDHLSVYFSLEGGECRRCDRKLCGGLFVMNFFLILIGTNLSPITTMFQSMHNILINFCLIKHCVTSCSNHGVAKIFFLLCMAIFLISSQKFSFKFFQYICVV